MKLRKWLENWDLMSLKIKAGVLEAEWKPQELDREAAWELYVEMLTRIVTQALPADEGDEKTALDSVHALFPITREILRRKGRDCVQFTKIAVVVLNQVVRPFTTKWHKEVISDGFKNPTTRSNFHKELTSVQEMLRRYTHALADIAQVEDLSQIEDKP